jgi:hypothetical protein
MNASEEQNNQYHKTVVMPPIVVNAIIHHLVKMMAVSGMEVIVDQNKFVLQQLINDV